MMTEGMGVLRGGLRRLGPFVRRCVVRQGLAPILLASMVFGGACSPVSTDVEDGDPDGPRVVHLDPEQEANQLYVQANLGWLSRSTIRTYSELLESYSASKRNLTHLLDAYGATQLAVSVVKGDALIWGRPIDDFLALEKVVTSYALAERDLGTHLALLARAEGDRERAAGIWHMRGMEHLAAGSLAQAEEAFEQARAWAEAVASPRELAGFLLEIAEEFGRYGRWPEALAFLDMARNGAWDSLQEHWRSGGERLRIVCLGRTGREAEAQAAARTMLSRIRGMNDGWNRDSALRDAASILALAGLTEEAAEVARQVAAMDRRLSVLCDVAQTAIADGELTLAVGILSEVEQKGVGLLDEARSGVLFGRIGALYAEAGEWGKADKIAGHIHEREGRSRLLIRMAEVRLAQGDRKEALDLLAMAHDAATGMEPGLERNRILTSLALTMTSAAQFDRAEALVDLMVLDNSVERARVAIAARLCGMGMPERARATAPLVEDAALAAILWAHIAAAESTQGREDEALDSLGACLGHVARVGTQNSRQWVVGTALRINVPTRNRAVISALASEALVLIVQDPDHDERLSALVALEAVLGGQDVEWSDQARDQLASMVRSISSIEALLAP